MEEKVSYFPPKLGLLSLMPFAKAIIFYLQVALQACNMQKSL